MEPQQQPQPGNQPPQQSGQTPQPLFNAPFQNPVPPLPPAPQQLPPPNDPGSKNKLVLILAIAGGLVLLLIIVLVVVVASSSDKAATDTKTQTSNTSKLQAPQAATSNGIQLNDDAVSQSLSTINDDQDFQSSKFADRSLSL